MGMKWTYIEPILTRMVSFESWDDELSNNVILIKIGAIQVHSVPTFKKKEFFYFNDWPVSVIAQRGK